MNKKFNNNKSLIKSIEFFFVFFYMIYLENFIFNLIELFYIDGTKITFYSKTVCGLEIIEKKIFKHNI